MPTILERESKTPLYQQISGQIRKQIGGGARKPGERLQTYKEMAKHFGVSSITVIQAVDELVQEGLIVRTRGSGIYVAEPGKRSSGIPPTEGDQTSATLCTLNIGLHAFDREHKNWTSFYHEPLRIALIDAVSKAGGRVIHEPITHDFLESAVAAGANGLVLGGLNIAKRHLLDKLKDANIPFVIVGGAFEDRLLPCVAVDNAVGIDAAIGHLVELGHRNIGFINMNLDGPDHQYRWKAFQRAVVKFGITVDSRLLLTDFQSYTLDVIKTQIRDWIDSGLPPFTALIACSYVEAMATMHILREKGLRIPEDVSLVGFDDPSSAPLLIPALTTVRQPLVEMAARGVERLTAAMRARQMLEGTEILPPTLIVRESTGIPAG